MPVIKDVTVVRIDCSPDDSNEPQVSYVIAVFEKA